MVPYMTVPHAFRYPGAKTKLAKTIIEAFPPYFQAMPLYADRSAEYREPFFGSGAIGLQILEALHPQSRAWINDADIGVANYWRSVHLHYDELIERVKSCQPSVDLYKKYRNKANNLTLDIVESGFITLFLHQCSYSGLGKKAGSPIGGWKQGDTKEYLIGCRWHPSTLVQEIMRCHKLLSCLDLRITHLDFEEVFQEITDHERTFFYCDPPYVKRGPELYAQSMTTVDHERLAARLHDINSPWVLSYDDDPLIHQLYAHCVQTPINARYTVRNGRRQTQQELLITPKPEAPIQQGKGYFVGLTNGYDFKKISVEYGLKADVIRNRIRRGKTLEQALSMPARPYQRS
jgi:DNA adenine methylase